MLDDGTHKTVGITRAHLEEDAGKSLHEGLRGSSGIDLNRAGTPLLEIVSEPDMRSAKEAVAYMQEDAHAGALPRDLRRQHAGRVVPLRCQRVGAAERAAAKLGTRTELKNLNSFRFIEKAINYEVARQIEILEGGGSVVQETRLYDADKDETRSMRSKEEANDYRYFPDPDLLPLAIDGFIDRSGAPHAAGAARREGARFATQYGLSAYDAGVLTASRELADYYEAVVDREPSAAR